MTSLRRWPGIESAGRDNSHAFPRQIIVSQVHWILPA